MGFVETILSNWAVVAIPLVSALVGWGTNVVAVQMMFHPTEFWGWKPYLGWQGIVPASARTLAKRSTKLITTQLLTLNQLFSGFDAEKMAGQLGPTLDELSEQILAEVENNGANEAFEKMPDQAKTMVRQMLRMEIGQAATRILQDIHQNVEEIIDLTEVVMSSVEHDKKLISELFYDVGEKEFRFIKVSGAYFGFLFGLVQMAAWVEWPIWWILPFAGFFVGYATNWLAIKLIFHPARPIRIGPFVLQGLFHKRQQEVAELFSAKIAERIMTPENIVRTISSGNHRERLFSIVHTRIGEVLDKYENNPMTAALFPKGQSDKLRAELEQRIEQELPRPGGFLFQFARRAMDIKGELVSRMRQLDPHSFEGVLRPAFQQDEWKLIVVGAALGLGAGFVQLVAFFGEVLAAA